MGLWIETVREHGLYYYLILDYIKELLKLELQGQNKLSIGFFSWKLLTNTTMGVYSPQLFCF